MPRGRRLRGLLLRLVLNRPIAMALGASIAAPAIVLLANDYSWETGATDGLMLLALATGVALVWSGITGRTADWYEE